MNTKNNRRSDNTRKKIKEVFIELLGSKTINKITVKDICRKADINRSTFYAHYSDVYDLFQKIVKEKQQSIKLLLSEPEIGTSRPLTEQKLEKLFKFISQNSDFYRVFLNDLNNINEIERSIAASWNQDIKAMLSKYKKKPEAEMQYRFEYFRSGLLAVVRKWLNKNCPESPAEMVVYLKNCFYMNNCKTCEYNLIQT